MGFSSRIIFSRFSILKPLPRITIIGILVATLASISGVQARPVVAAPALSVTVRHALDSNGNVEVSRRIRITSQNIAELLRSFDDFTVLVGYMSELTVGSACFEGDPTLVIRDLLNSRDVIDFYGDEECAGSTRVSQDGRSILADCDNEGVKYQVRIPSCGEI